MSYSGNSSPCLSIYKYRVNCTRWKWICANGGHTEHAVHVAHHVMHERERIRSVLVVVHVEWWHDHRRERVERTHLATTATCRRSTVILLLLLLLLLTTLLLLRRRQERVAHHRAEHRVDLVVETERIEHSLLFVFYLSLYTLKTWSTQFIYLNYDCIDYNCLFPWLETLSFNLYMFACQLLLPMY